MRIGDPVAAIGAPFGQVESLSAGVVSQIATQIRAPAAVCFFTPDAIQTDAAINPGNSGGPLFNAAGRVIAVNSQIDTGGGGDANTGVAFAVPINAAKRSLHEISTTGRVRYAWLGVGGVTLTPDIVSALQLPAARARWSRSSTRGAPRRGPGSRPARARRRSTAARCTRTGT